MIPATGVFEESNKLNICLNQSKGCMKVFKREINSLKPFGVRVGLVKGVRKIAILVSYYFISSNLFTLLISYPEDSIIS
jgi:hypothetical protein